jgi:hypothetical protein
VRRLRLIFACLLLLALPLQGMAAALKLSCLAHESGAAIASHLHADGAAHHHSDDSATAPGLDSHGAEHANHYSDASCSVCAACCHGAMASETATVPALFAPSDAVTAPLAVAMRLRATPPPDKPPRA